MSSPSMSPTSPAAPSLFDPLTLRDVELRNRIVIAPMQQFSAATDGLVNDWHLMHLARFALGGAGTVFVESTAVEARGRNTHGDLGIWDDAQVAPLARLAALLREHGATPALQLGHTGRKAAQQLPWRGYAPLTEADAAHGEPPWTVIAPSALPVDASWPVPEALSSDGVEALVEAWGQAARRATEAGFSLLEIHGAHGYLLHQFLSPVSNQRTDAWGGSMAGRQRLPLAVVKAVREHWPAHLPLAWRASLTDLDDGTLPMDEMVAFVSTLRDQGVDVLDCSSGGGIGSHPTTGRTVPRGLNFRAADAAELRRRTGIAIMGVGFVIQPQQAQDYLDAGQADLVAVGREALYNPNWALHARQALAPQLDYADWPRPYRGHLAKRGPLADAERQR